MIQKQYLIIYTLVIFIFKFNCYSFSQKKCFEGYSPAFITADQKDIAAALKQREQDFFKFVQDCEAPDFTAVTTDGETISLDNLKGKIIVINFWHMQCLPCIAEIPALNKLYEEYKNENVVFLAPSRSGREDIVKNFLPKHPFKFKIIPDCGTTDDPGSITEKYKMFFGWPTTFVLDKKNKVRYIKHGGKTDENDDTVYILLKQIIDELLKK